MHSHTLYVRHTLWWPLRRKNLLIIQQTKKCLLSDPPSRSNGNLHPVREASHVCLLSHRRTAKQELHASHWRWLAWPVVQGVGWYRSGKALLTAGTVLTRYRSDGRDESSCQTSVISMMFFHDAMCISHSVTLSVTSSVTLTTYFSFNRPKTFQLNIFWVQQEIKFSE